jgi:hypothetical protein
MKTYSEYMDEISADELYEALLGYGFFAEHIPPFLTSTPFYYYCLQTAPQFSNKARQYVYYENIRNINIPRHLGIPTPMNYQKLCMCLKQNWSAIQDHFRNKTTNQIHKVSRIHIRKLQGKKHFFEMNYSNWKQDPSPDEDMIIDKYCVVYADISNCFPSIYTHSIPWALVGKDTAKTQRDRACWFNQIDYLTQNMKHGETHGLLIGPHVSNLLSEIILTAVDFKLVDKDCEYVRNIDDYTCYVRSEHEARQFLVDLQKKLREFDLTLNHRKTIIERLPLASTKSWVRKINSVTIITSYGKVNYKNCRAYLDFAIEIAQEEDSNSAVLKYAIKVLHGLDLTENAKRYMQQTVFHLCLIYPYLTPLLEDYIFSFCGTRTSEIQALSNKLYNLGMEDRRFEASSYALYFALKYGFKLDCVDVHRIIESKDCIQMLLGFLYFSSVGDNTSIKELKDHAWQLAQDDDDFNMNWLFTYEVLSAADLKDEWKAMKRAGVSFIKDSL